VSVRRILVVASSPVIRAGLETLLARAGDYTVLGSARLPGLPAAENATVPDVIVLALDADGDAGPIAQLAAYQGPAAPPLVVIGDEPVVEWGARALRLGARAVLSHAAGPAEIVAAVEAAAVGLIALPPELIGNATRAQRALEAVPPTLTAREVEILGLLAAGLANKTIGARLGISEHTVKSHVAALFAKLGVSTRAEAVAVAVRQGALML
jgi:DNA-binding NarL/FixJ family response regulator